MLFYHILIFLSGACWASFWVTLGFRLTHPELISHRSVCPHCQHPLHFWQLVPLLGWCLQRGQCTNCRQPIDPFSTCCELVCGTFAVVNDGQPQRQLIAILILSSCLLIMSTTDWYDYWINPWLLTGLLPLAILAPRQTLISFEWVVVVLLAVALLTAVFCQLLGAGDAELLMVLLFTVGLTTTAIILLVACLTLLGWLAFNDHRQQRLAFVPWLSIGIAVTIATIEKAWGTLVPHAW